MNLLMCKFLNVKKNNNWKKLKLNYGMEKNIIQIIKEIQKRQRKDWQQKQTKYDISNNIEVYMHTYVCMNINVNFKIE